MTEDTRPYNIATIRRLLLAAFTTQTLRRFCHDHPSFRPIVDSFSPHHGLDEMVDRVITYCETHSLFDELLARVKEGNPHQYAHFEPNLRSLQPIRASLSRRSRPTWLWIASVLLLALVVAIGVWWLLTSKDHHVSEPTAPPSSAKRGDTWLRPTDSMVMVYVPAGEFRMGSSREEVQSILAECEDCQPEWYESELPWHPVQVNAFWIDKIEVTNLQYRKCVDAGACAEAECPEEETSEEKRLNAPDQPVVCVTWTDAQNYAAWAGGRLPTEAEWEYAARGPQGRRYPWGDPFDGTRLNYCNANCAMTWADETIDDGYAESAPVGRYSTGESWCGALDMAGNVWEWVADWYDAEYYSSFPSDNPQGPTTGTLRVQRGGSYLTPERNLHCAFRGYQMPDKRLTDLGFRVVVPASRP